MKEKIKRYVIFTAVAASFLFGRTPTVPEGKAEVHFIDVGQGDCELIRTHDANVLIDAGTTDARYRTADYVKHHAQGIDLMILTHPHEDHIGGAADVIEAVFVNELMTNGGTSDEACFARLAKAAGERGVPVTVAVTGKSVTFGDLTITIVSDGTDSGNENDASIVVRADFGECSFLFTGDAEEAAEEEMLASSRALLDCDVLKAGHHGSATSTSEAFLAAVTPDIAVIEVGRDNDYGHPAAALLDRLADMRVLRTDRDGTVVVETDGKTLAVVN